MAFGHWAMLTLDSLMQSNWNSWKTKHVTLVHYFALSLANLILNVRNFFRVYGTDEDKDDLLDDVIDGGIKYAEDDDLDDRAARFLLYWTTITKVSFSWQYGESKMCHYAK